MVALETTEVFKWFRDWQVRNMYSFASQTLLQKKVSLPGNYTCSLLASSLPVFSPLIRIKVVSNALG